MERLQRNATPTRKLSQISTQEEEFGDHDEYEYEPTEMDRQNSILRSPKVACALGELFLNSPTNIKAHSLGNLFLPLEKNKSNNTKSKSKSPKHKRGKSQNSFNSLNSASSNFLPRILLTPEKEIEQIEQVDDSLEKELLEAEEREQIEKENLFQENRKRMEEIKVQELIKCSQEKAFDWLKPAADQRIADAQYYVGLMYYKGEGVKRSLERAFEYLKNSAENGHPDAAFCLGNMYIKGEYCEKSIEKAIIWYKFAAKIKRNRPCNTFACINLAIFFREGITIEEKDVFDKKRTVSVVLQRDLEKSFKYLFRAASNGHAESQFDIGMMLATGEGCKKNIEQAVEFLTKSAKQGNVCAQTNLGLLYLKGGEITKNLKMAKKWFKLGAKQKDSKALFNLGWIWEKEAIEMEEKEKQKKNSPKKKKNSKNSKKSKRSNSPSKKKQSISNLEILKEIEDEISKDNAKESKRLKLLRKAFKSYKKAAVFSQNQNIEAVLALGTCYFKGIGVDISQEKGFSLFLLAADPLKGNDIDAQAMVGLCYKDGVGVSKDLQKAVHFLRMAADRGDSRSQINVAILFQDELKDAANAFHYFSLAGAKGETIAEENLARIYALGEGGVPKSEENAFFYTKLLADKGSVAAQFETAMMCEHGKMADKEAAKYYLEKVCLAAKHGDEQTISILKQKMNENEDNTDLLIDEFDEILKNKNE